MESFLLFSVTIYLSICFAGGAEVQFPCDDWIPYKDEKCVKLYTLFATRQQAEDFCSGEHSASSSGPSLVSIRSLDEQKFLTEYIFNSSDASNRIWIGAQRQHGNSSEFAWNDGSSVQRFTYWDVSRPTEVAERSCVLLQPPLVHGTRTNADLRWVDVSCTSGNWFICERQQSWSIERLHHTILSVRRDLQYEVDRLKRDISDMAETIDELRRNSTVQATTLANHGSSLASQGTTLATQGTTLATQGTTLAIQGTNLATQGTTLNTHNTQLRSLQDNPVPIGFVYVQLSGQPEPQSMWSSVSWSEITSTYAGLFFRAAGGNATVFGSTQEENSPRLTSVRRVWPRNITDVSVSVGLGNWSPSISTGVTPGSTTHSGLIFLLSKTEVRPRNQAVRIWRRV